MLSACSLQGEKYLVLKKKYRQMLQERVGRHPRADVDGQRHASPARSPATAPWDATHTQAVSRRSHAAAEVTFMLAGVDSVTTLRNPKVSESTSNATVALRVVSLPTQRCLCWCAPPPFLCREWRSCGINIYRRILGNTKAGRGGS